jgi:transposase
MQGKQPPERELFCKIDLEIFVPKDHLLRKIDRIVDLDFLYDITASLYCADNGRPSVDPVLFFRMQLIGYLYGIDSDRQLCREIHLNLAYRWFCRIPLQVDVPDHSSLTRIRDRLGEEKYREIFECLLAQWRGHGHVEGKCVVADATLISANAAMDSLVERVDGDPNARALKNYDKRYHDFQHGKRQRRVANQTHVSRTDPDATMVFRRGLSGGLKYKVHYCADAKSRIITDCYTTTGSTQEGPLLPGRIDYLCNELGFDVGEVIADRGYGRGPTYSAFRKRQIRTYIPLHDARLGKGKLTPTTFIYQSRTDRYLCPQGHYLYPYEKQDKGIKRYRMLGGHCRACPQRETCLPESAKQRARYVYRSVHQHEIDHVRRRQRTPAFGARMTERKWKIEGLFAEAKLFHSLRRARYRGLAKVSIQALMTAISQNLKRVAKSTPLWLYLCLFKLMFFDRGAPHKGRITYLPHLAH